jgi:cell division protein FtsI/penicillin-binding protein 2
MHKTLRATPALRGAIRDCNGELLAHDKPAFDAWVSTRPLRFLPEVKQRLSKVEKTSVPHLVESSSNQELLARYTDHVARVVSYAVCGDDQAAAQEKRQELLRLLAKEKNGEFPIQKGISDEEANVWRKLLEDNHVTGVTLRPSVKRAYPCQERLTHVLGFVNYQHEGKEGIEALMNSRLTGVEGFQEIECDRRGQEIPRFRGASKQPVNGQEVWLTIDMNLQEVLEDALEEAAELYRPRKIVSIIVEPKSGAILALSSRPLPERREHQRGNARFGDPFSATSPAIAQEYEPGSVFKIITFAGVFDRKLAGMNELINCDAEQKAVAHLKLHDHISGKVTVAEVLAKSSNVGSYLLARRLGEDSFMDYVSRFGFGKRTGVELTGEIRGNIAPRSRWDSLTFSRMVIGHSISVTPLQMVMATAAIANGGNLMKPQLIRQVRDADGIVVRSFKPEQVTRVCSAQAAALVTRAMEGVLDENGKGNTGKKAQVTDVRVAGKTGTSQLMNAKGTAVDKGHYAVSFTGFAPADDPQLCVLVVVDDPHSPHGEPVTGGEVAGPIFAQIMKHSLMHRSVAVGGQPAESTPGNGGTR